MINLIDVAKVLSCSFNNLWILPHPLP